MPVTNGDAPIPDPIEHEFIDREEYIEKKDFLEFASYLENLDEEDQANLVLAFIESNQVALDSFSDRFSKMVDDEYEALVADEDDKVIIDPYQEECF